MTTVSDPATGLATAVFVIGFILTAASYLDTKDEVEKYLPPNLRGTWDGGSAAPFYIDGREVPLDLRRRYHRTDRFLLVTMLVAGPLYCLGQQWTGGVLCILEGVVLLWVELKRRRRSRRR
jgi:hypothetical protein